jgi:hypothetical protein
MTYFLAGLIGGFLNWIRGGGIGHIIPRPGRSLYWVSLAITLLMLPFVSAWVAVTLGIAFLLGGAKGWGSYFDCGRKAKGYNDSPEVAWIDALLLKMYGHEWAVSEENVNPRRLKEGELTPPSEDATLFEKIEYKINMLTRVNDVVVNGKTRPYEWRRMRDCTGMALRSLHYLPFFLVLPIAYGDAVALLPIIGLVAFAPLYYVSRLIWDKVEDKFGSIHWKVFSGTALAEWLTGMSFGLMIWGQYVIAA